MAAPFVVHFDEARVDQMRRLLKLSSLPTEPVDALDDDTIDLGVRLDWLKSSKFKLENLDASALEDHLNKFSHFTAPIEDLTLHFVHQRSARSNAIPLLLLHGWPGLFYDFHKVIDQLTSPADLDTPAFHVVIPSLPGFAWSSLPRRAHFSIVDMARIFNTLMVDVLGYKKYAALGGDWGSFVLRYMGQNHTDHLELAHFTMFPTAPVKGAELSELEQAAMVKRVQFVTDGRGYFDLQSTRPATIGHAIACSPLSMLAYIGEKLLAWSDPRSLDLQDIISTVAIYYLTESFQTSVMIYKQSKANVMDLLNESSWGKIQCKMAYSFFPHEISHGPKEWIAKAGPLVEYYVHDKGGHFAALDNPEAIVDDVRLFVKGYWRDVLV